MTAQVVTIAGRSVDRSSGGVVADESGVDELHLFEIGRAHV